MPTFEHDRVALAYDESGASNLSPIVLIHGLSSSRATWERIMPALRARYHVFRIDLRGHGESTHAPGTYILDRYSADVIAFLTQVVSVPAVLVGHSLGGVVAADLARRRADLVAALVLEDPPMYRGDPAEATADRGPIASLFPVMQHMLRDLQARRAPLADYVAMLRAAPTPSGRGTFADVLGEAGTLAQARAMARLDPEIFTPAIDGRALATPLIDAPITCPVRVLRADSAMGAAFTAADEVRFLTVNPTATVVCIAGASHAIHDEEPERFTAELLAGARPRPMP
jgi:pimeloyl-ACP methyl ester carboxylesterase